VPGGGTGVASLTGYVKGAGTANFTASESIPVADVNGAVRTVNGTPPNASGDVVISSSSGTTTTGTLAALPAQPKPLGAIYVVKGDPSATNNGRTYISDGAAWLEVINDARYVLKSGSTMSGNLTVPAGAKVLIADPPVGPTEAANKAYVDSNGGSVPDATETVKGKIALTGDLTGSADDPIINANKVTFEKFQKVSQTCLLGNALVVPGEIHEIVLGTVSLNGYTLNSPFSFYNGNDPSNTVDRPDQSQVLYMGTNSILWYWSNNTYYPVSPVRLLRMFLGQTQLINATNNLLFDYAEQMTVLSKQGLLVSRNQDLFELELDQNRLDYTYVKMTVSIPNLLTSNVVVHIGTYDVSNSNYTPGPGLTLSTDVNVSCCCSYTEILRITPGTTRQVAIRVRSITGTSSAVQIGTLLSLSKRYVMFEEL
jgi:hypothetical protein